MDWSEKISLFKPITTDQVEGFAPAGEMERAVLAYNNAIGRLQSNSQDTALIALRKLAATYPHFGQPAFLLACCLAKNGQAETAKGFVNQALEAGLPADLAEAALACQKSLADLPQKEAEAVDVGAGRVVLEKVRRRGKVRLASKKERREVLHGRDPGQERQVKIKTPIDLSLLLPAGLAGLALILLVTTIFLTVAYFRTRSKDKKPDPAVDQLTWLVSQLEELAEQDQNAADLVKRFETLYSSQQTEALPSPPAESKLTTAVPSQETSIQPTVLPTPTPTAAPTATPAPTPSPTPDPAVVILQEADELYARALSTGKSDEVAFALDLVAALEKLGQIPENTLAASLDLSAGTLKEQIEKEIAGIRKTAPGKLRLLADKEFKQERYAQALAFYLPAYTIDPRSRNGGVAYYVGRCYQELGDFNSARPYYEYVVKTFAKRDIAKSAAWRLRQMDG